MSVITISRLDASRGEEVAALVALNLGFRLVARKLMKELIYSYDLLSSLGRMGEPGGGEGTADEEAHIRAVTEGVVFHLAFKENIVFLGPGGQFLFRGCPSSFHARIIASLSFRRRNFHPQGKEGPDEALLRGDRKRRQLVRRHCGEDLRAPEHYDLIVKMDSLGVEGAAEAIVASVRSLPWEGDGRFDAIRSFGQRRGVEEISLDPLPPVTAKEIVFAHPSEAEFARVLDFYRIRWEYEPTSFPIEWWPDGRVKESFTPDFYLSETDVFLELTTMKQSLVTKKNRKVRRFRELYPDRTLNIFYGRDYRKLALKYGLE
jgi:hypothetical protein